MPLPQHAGLDALDYTPGAVRTEMGDALLASLYVRPNLLAAMPIGQFGGGGAGVGAAAQVLAHYWVEDRLNPRQVTDLTGGGLGAATATMTVTAADGSVVDVGYFMQDVAQSQQTAEMIQITGITPGNPNYTLNISRGQLGTTASTHALNAIFAVIAPAVPQGSSLGRDMSRTPGIKSNFIQTYRRDVKITAAMIALAQHGFVPGIPNQLAYQLHQRFLELLIDWEQSFIKGLGTPAGTTTDFQTMYGWLSWLGFAAVNANATAVILNANGAPISDFLINTVGINLYNQGAEIPDAIIAAPIAIDRTARIYRDQMRITQDELVRGYFVDAIRMSLGVKPVRLIMTGYMPAPVPPAVAPTPAAIFASLDRAAIVPFLDQFCYLISAPSFDDADAISVLTKMTFELRNTGTDYGYAHQVLYNFGL